MLSDHLLVLVAEIRGLPFGQRAQQLQLSEEKCRGLEHVKIVGVLFVRPGARTEKNPCFPRKRRRIEKMHTEK